MPHNSTRHQDTGAVVADGTLPALRLDLKDRELIHLLSENSRTPLAQIAKVLRTSSEVIHYRFERLRHSKIITETFTIIDPALLGLVRYVVYLQFHAVTSQRMSSLVQHLLKNPFVSWVLETGGKWELIVMFQSNETDGVDAILSSIVEPHQSIINDYQISLVRSFVHKGPHFIGKQARRASQIQLPYQDEFSHSGELTLKLDRIDLEILNALDVDARMPLTELARLTNLSSDAVDYRIKKLIRAKIIRGFILRLNYHLLGFQYVTIMLRLRGVAAKKKQALFAFVEQDERFYCWMEQLGAWDLSLMMFFRDAKDLRQFLLHLKENFNETIHSYETMLHFDQFRFRYLAPGAIRNLKLDVQRIQV